MDGKTTITPEGKLVTEVINRNEHLCSAVYKVTNACGKQESDEETGPDQEPMTEVAGEW